MNIRQTHTFALLELSGPAFEEVKGKLTAAGYGHAFTEVDGKPVIDMHGIAVVAEPPGIESPAVKALKPGDQVAYIDRAGNVAVGRVESVEPE